MRTVKIAVVGAGYWGTKLAREYLLLSKSTEGVCLDSVADLSEDRLKELRSELGDSNVRFRVDYREALEDPDIDAVHIALPNHLHYETAAMALESGKHVLVEKPMTTSSRQALKLANISEEKGLVLQVGHIFRFNNSLREVARIIRQNTIGRIFYCILSWATQIEPPRDRDVVFDLAPHPIDVLNYLLGEWPTTVSAMGDSYLRGEVGREETAFVNLKLPSRVMANIYLSWIHHGARRRQVEIIAEKASLDCDALNQTITVHRSGGHKEKIEVSANNTIRDMQLHFVERIRARGPQFNNSLIGATTVQVLEAITHSMKTGSPVRLSFV